MNTESAKPIAILGQTGDFPTSPLAPLDQTFAKTGLNTGNLAFFHAVRSHIANPVGIVPWHFEPGIVNENFSALIMPAANMVNSFQDHGELARRYAELRVPVAIVGLGTQLPLGADPSSLKVPEGTLAFLRALSDIGAQVGCRGETSRRFFEMHGLNAQVIGCPSNFTNPRTDLGEFVAGKYGDIGRGIFGHCDFNRRLARINRKVVSWVETHGGMISIQDPAEGFKLAMRDPATMADPAIMGEAALIFDVEPKSLLDLVLNRFIAFADWQSWSFYARSFSLSIGTRMHGNMISFQAEVPSILVPHDSRVSELAETMMMPRISMSDVLEIDELSRVFELLTFDGVAYDNNRKSLASKYFKILKDIGIEVSAEFNSLG